MAITDYYTSKYSGEEIDALLNGDGGAGGTKNYNDLVNKPSINGVTLQGALTSKQLGIIAEQGKSATIRVGTVSTAPSGEVPTVENVGTENDAIFNFRLPQGQKGDQGEQGIQGDAGSSIERIERTAGTGTSGSIDTYTVFLTNGQTSTFKVYNGRDGTGAGDMVADVYDPQGKVQDIFAYADNVLANEKGQANGVATLDESGKVPSEQLPPMDYIPNNEKGTANGVAPLNENGVLDIKHGGINANDIQQAIYNLGVRPNKNHLINWDMRNPINQRGKTTYAGASYGIDVWKGVYGSEIVNILRDKIQIVVSGNQAIRQIIEFPEYLAGKTVTLSILWALNGDYANFAVSDGNSLLGSIGKTGSFSLILDSRTFDIAEDTEKIFVDIAGQGTIDVFAAKLEIGENQTLARQKEDGSWQLLETPDNSTELLKCQRYLQLYSSPELRPSKAIDCRPVMRIDPTQTTIQIGDVTYYVNDANL